MYALLVGWNFTTAIGQVSKFWEKQRNNCGSDSKVSAYNAGDPGLISEWVGKIPWRRKWQPTPVLLPRKSHGRRSLVGYIPWGCKESDMTEWLQRSLERQKGSGCWTKGLGKGRDLCHHAFLYPCIKNLLAPVPWAHSYIHLYIYKCHAVWLVIS